MSRVVIYGVGDIARVVRVYLTKDSPHEVAAFTVPGQSIRGSRLLGIPVVPFESLEEEYPPSEYAMFVAMGFTRLNADRAAVYELCKAKGYHLLSYVSSRALHFGEFEVGDNCLIGEGTIVQPFAQIGNDVFIWAGGFIGHDVQIGDHCFISSHAVLSGRLIMDSYCFVGAGACFRDGIHVAARSVIGAGAVILRNTREGGVYAMRSTGRMPLDSSDLRLK